MLKKVVIIGPESTGKSTLSEQLAVHYQTTWCPEYARAYLLENGTRYSFDELEIIAKGQLQLEDEYALRAKNAGADLLFIDTDMYVMKVWCEFVFGKCHRFILDEIAGRKYDLYLFCNIDMPWVQDELREHPDPESRQQLYHIYKDILINQPVPWIDISGTHEERLQRAVQGIDHFLRSGID